MVSRFTFGIIASLLQILALALDEVFAFYCLAIEDNIGECRNPVAKEYAARVLAKRNVDIDVTVTEDEAIDS